jgi:hypothetical protein
LLAGSYRRLGFHPRFPLQHPTARRQIGFSCSSSKNQFAASHTTLSRFAAGTGFGATNPAAAEPSAAALPDTLRRPAEKIITISRKIYCFSIIIYIFAETNTKLAL